MLDWQTGLIGLSSLALGALGGLAAARWKTVRAPRSPLQSHELSDEVRGRGEVCKQRLSEMAEGLRRQGRELHALIRDDSPEWAARLELVLAENHDLQEKLHHFTRSIQDQLADLDQYLKEARTDALTGLWNRRAFEEHLSIQLAIATRYHTPFSIVLFDIDHFKQVNDVHGHAAGDEVLRQFAFILTDGVRACDLVTRYGGEEYALLLPQSGLVGAASIAERLRIQTQSTPFQAVGTEIFLQISAGVATFAAGDDCEALLVRADRALYRSKDAGRNCVHLHNGDEVLELGPLLATTP